MAPIVGNPPGPGGDYATIDQKWLVAFRAARIRRRNALIACERHARSRPPRGQLRRAAGPWPSVRHPPRHKRSRLFHPAVAAVALRNDRH
jgi:hypothetical protein